MSYYSEAQGQPLFVSRVRSMSKSGFMCESQSKSPRLDKMIAHISLYDKTTECIERELEQERRNSLAQRRIYNSSSTRPGMSPRTSEDEVTSPSDVWAADLVCKPRQDTSCVYVTEVREVEDFDD